MNELKNVLILCTGNSCRSIIGEALVNHLGKGRYRGYSAGSKPAGLVNPAALVLLQRKGLETTGLRSKSWDEFAGPDAPVMDFIFTVCDNAAGEACPVWPGHRVSAHWPIADPADVDAADSTAVELAFELAWRRLYARIEAFVRLSDEQTTAENLARIGEMTDEDLDGGREWLAMS